MKRFALVAVAALTLAVAMAAPALSQNGQQKATHFPPVRCEPGPIRAFAARIWDQDRWRRGNPKSAAVETFWQRVGCAPRSEQPELRHFWHEIQATYYSARRLRLWRQRVTPFPGGGRWWAIPYWHVVCESGANYYVGYAGAYGLTAPAWNGYGGLEFAATAGEASPREQDIVAHRLWKAAGDSAWSPFEGGCV